MLRNERTQDSFKLFKSLIQTFRKMYNPKKIAADFSVCNPCHTVRPQSLHGRFEKSCFTSYSRRVLQLLSAAVAAGGRRVLASPSAVLRPDLLLAPHLHAAWHTLQSTLLSSPNRHENIICSKSKICARLYSRHFLHEDLLQSCCVSNRCCASPIDLWRHPICSACSLLAFPSDPVWVNVRVVKISRRTGEAGGRSVIAKSAACISSHSMIVPLH